LIGQAPYFWTNRLERAALPVAGTDVERLEFAACEIFDTEFAKGAASNRAGGWHRHASDCGAILFHERFCERHSFDAHLSLAGRADVVSRIATPVGIANQILQLDPHPDLGHATSSHGLAAFLSGNASKN
jgi:hypothetical protein